MAHKTHEELIQLLEDATKKIEVGKKYFHYKHPENLYLVEGLELREESEEVSVRYKSLYGKGLVWNRLLSEWLKPAQLDGKEIERFQKVEE